jgi:hypothetical protein
MKKIFERHQFYWKQKSFRLSMFLGILFFSASLVINHFISIYVDSRASNFVRDIILDNVRAFDVDGLLTYGVITFFIFVITCLFVEPKRFPFVLKSTALFYLIRSIFISLTHLGPSPLQTPINPSDFLSSILIGNDFFFSGHTGMPFLVALMFWDIKRIRYISLFASLFFGALVLLGHLHYSIDVFAAFFISYSIFHISKKFFSVDYKLFQEQALL